MTSLFVPGAPTGDTLQATLLSSGFSTCSISGEIAGRNFFFSLLRKPESWCWVVSKFSVGSEKSFSFQENTILGGSLCGKGNDKITIRIDLSSGHLVFQRFPYSVFGVRICLGLKRQNYPSSDFGVLSKGCTIFRAPGSRFPGEQNAFAQPAVPALQGFCSFLLPEEYKDLSLFYAG